MLSAVHNMAPPAYLVCCLFTRRYLQKGKKLYSLSGTVEKDLEILPPGWKEASADDIARL